MKNKKLNYLLLIIIGSMGLVTYGFFTAKKSIVVGLTQAKKTISVPAAPGSPILGTWVREDDSNYKLVFGLSAKMQIYVSNVEEFSGTFIITTTCDGQTWNDGEGIGSFLQIKDPTDNTITCQFINGLNDNNSGRLILTPVDQMTPYVYIKQ